MYLRYLTVYREWGDNDNDEDNSEMRERMEEKERQERENFIAKEFKKRRGARVSSQKFHEPVSGKT